ncbi:MAG: COX15/CtaA family protein [Verrucomicrobiota bacterium]|nr:COX15/CtaA family protein [Verrucomicrobiota bacterium]
MKWENNIQKRIYYYAFFTTLWTWFLVWVGGVVTSMGAGLSVPDWPTSYGYHMFLLPWEYWIGGAFFEHTHRLVATFAGFFMLSLWILLLIHESRKWVKQLSLILLVLVILQGLLGGSRVTMLKDELGIFHGCLAQVYLVLLGFLTLVLSPYWRSRDRSKSVTTGGDFGPFFKTLTIVIFFQLALGATMRHEHAGLSITDFPTVYGKVLPDVSPSSMEKINAQRVDDDLEETTPTYIMIQFVHRLVAYGLVVVAVYLIFRRHYFTERLVKWFVLIMAGLIFIQVALGIATILTQKAADVATAHVAIGALIFLLSGLLSALCSRENLDQGT